MATAVAPSASLAHPAASPVRLPRSPAVFAACATAIAGYLDAVGYAQLSHLYVSFMSGNSTHLGMSIADGAWSDVISAVTVVAAFVIGSALGPMVAARSGASGIRDVLLAELLVLLVALTLAATGGPRPALFIVAVAMGMQNAMHQLISGADVGRSFITGALSSLGQSLAQLLGGKGCVRRTLVLAASWLAFVFGAVAGSFVLATVGLLPALIIVVVLLALATLLFVVRLL